MRWLTKEIAKVLREYDRREPLGEVELVVRRRNPKIDAITDEQWTRAIDSDKLAVGMAAIMAANEIMKGTPTRERPFRLIRSIKPGRGWLLFNADNGWKKVTEVRIVRQVDDKVEIEAVAPTTLLYGEKLAPGERGLITSRLVEDDDVHRATLRSISR